MRLHPRRLCMLLLHLSKTCVSAEFPAFRRLKTRVVLELACSPELSSAGRLVSVHLPLLSSLSQDIHRGSTYPESTDHLRPIHQAAHPRCFRHVGWNYQAVPWMYGQGIEMPVIGSGNNGAVCPKHKHVRRVSKARASTRLMQIIPYHQVFLV